MGRYRRARAVVDCAKPPLRVSGAMKRARLLFFVALLLTATAVLVVPLVDAAAPSPGVAMAEAANKLLAGLTPEQKKKATFALEDAHRTEWFYVPLARKGIPLKQLTPPQRELVHGLLRAGLGPAGYAKTTQIIELDKVLAEMEKDPVKRDPQLYYVSIFGTPAAKGTWGWRVEGHHVSHNFTIVNGTLIATTPQFLGANPAEVRVEGPWKGRRVLHVEEDLGHDLMASLDDKQRAHAVVATEATAEILSKNLPKADPLAPAGLPAKLFTAKQTETLRKLLAEYAARLPDPLARERLAKVEKAGLDKVHFAWAGGTARGEKYYYRLQGPTFLVECDNTQNNGNHVHTVWRDFDGDFGRDLLKEHYQAAHGAR
jgi:uncharacterized protein DUF3500